ncbi:MAG: M16 family metallopeptidase [Bryobacteraceae bacterium]
MRKPLLAFLAGAALFATNVKPIPPVRFTDTRLDNGLRVIIAEDRHAPIYAIAVSYAVGSKDERPGRTGFAHLFEHMMFKGSQNVGAGEHFYLIFNNGGSMNGTTNNDRTLYYEVLPKNQLDLGLFLEADRMRSLAVTRENLENQRQAVKEERRMRLDNQPYAKSRERIDELAYDAFPYKHSVIGSMADLDAATVEDVGAFFKTYYAPNNAVLALVGDIDTKETLAKVKKYFGGIPKQTSPQGVDFAQPGQTAERRETVADPLARLAQITMAYRIPPARSSDVDALTVMNSILSGGQSSRLYQKLVKEKEAAVQAGAFVNGRIGPGLFMVSATVRPGKTVEEVEKLLDEEIARVRTDLVTDSELQRARVSARRSAVSGLTSALNRAIHLADDAVLYNDPGRMNTIEQKRAAVTAAQIRDTAQKHLTTMNRTVVITQPAARPPAAAKPKPAAR